MNGNFDKVYIVIQLKFWYNVLQLMKERLCLCNELMQRFKNCSLDCLVIRIFIVQLGTCHGWHNWSNLVKVKWRPTLCDGHETILRKRVIPKCCMHFLFFVFYFFITYWDGSCEWLWPFCESPLIEVFECRQIVYCNRILKQNMQQDVAGNLAEFLGLKFYGFFS